MEFNYELIVAICKKMLVKQLWDRHLEDLIQAVSLKYLERDCKANIKWLCLDYFRENGIGPRGKLTAKTLETAKLVGYEACEDEENENYFLFNNLSKEKSEAEEKQLHAKDNYSGIIEEFIAPFNFNNEVSKWIIENYRPNLKHLKKQ
jgi:hypothetical protein